MVAAYVQKEIALEDPGDLGLPESALRPAQTLVCANQVELLSTSWRDEAVYRTYELWYGKISTTHCTGCTTRRYRPRERLV